MPSFFRRPPNSAEGSKARRTRVIGVILLGILLLVYWYLNRPFARTIPIRSNFPDQTYFSDHADKGIPAAYSAALVAMGEPSLWRTSGRARGDAYRFLCVHSSVGRSFAVRITRTGNGAELRMIELDDEESGSRTNPIREERTVSLSLAQWTDLDNLAGMAGFWEMPSRDDRVISDGTALIVEGVRDGQYHGVHRQSPPRGPYLRLCCYLVDVCGPGHPILMGDRVGAFPRRAGCAGRDRLCRERPPGVCPAGTAGPTEPRPAGVCLARIAGPTFVVELLSMARVKKSPNSRQTTRRGTTSRKSDRPLTGHVAVVAGATRGAGRGIACALGEAGAIVYCTGRSVRGNLSPYGRPETIDETAEIIKAEGATAIAVRVDHSVESEVEPFFARIDREHGRLDVLVNSIAGEEPMMGQWNSFWTTNLTDGEAVFRQALLSHIITAKHAAPLMIRGRRGLIVEVTESDTLSAGGNPLSQTVKLALKGLAFNMAAELKPHGVAAIAITPGFLRSEAMLERLGVSEANWRDAGKEDKNFLESESPMFVGRAVAALARDDRVLDRSGQLYGSWELGREYGFTDADGRRPDWGSIEIDFSGLPPALVELMRTGSEIQLELLKALSKRTKRFLGQLPRANSAPRGRTRQ